MSAKVRIACRRCRTKRIKCDGGIPACGNCQKAAEPCIDVDGRNKSISIPRDFAANARARIEWLEQQIRSLSPGFNLEDGPRVDFGFQEAAGSLSSQTAPSPGSPDVTRSTVAPSPDSSHTLGKRSHASIAEPAGPNAFADEARSVALDLGLLTLNSDSRQTHYLGTSSGRLFTTLIGAGSPEAALQTGSDKTPGLPSIYSPAKLGSYAHAKRLKESYRLLYATLKKSLPPEEDARLLLEAYFRTVHIDHPFLHPESLLLAVDALYQCATADATTEIGHNGWVASVRPFAYNGEFERSRNIGCIPISIFTATFHVFMVFTLAATVRTRQGAYDFASNQFYRVAMTANQHCFSNMSLASLQATLLLAVHSLLSPTELNIWTLTYVAMAHCVDLGLHRNSTNDSSLSHAAVLTRKMLFFSVYHLDRSIASIQGRPLGIRDETFDLQLPTLSDIQADIASIDDKMFAPAVSLMNGLAFAIHRFKLDPIISEIKLLFYHLPSRVSAYVWPSDQQSSQATISQKLEDWRSEISQIIESLPRDEEDQLEHDKYRLKLTSQYYAAMVLLHQPSQAIPQPTEQSLLTCYECATKRLNVYNNLYQTDNFFLSWRSIQGIFSSGATMIYCLWTSSLVRRVVSVSVAMRDLRTCTNLLSVGGELWPSVKKGKESLGRAMDALSRKLDHLHYQDYQRLESLHSPQMKFGRNETGRVVRQEAPAFQSSENLLAQTYPHAVSQEHENPSNFSHTPFNVTDPHWTVFGEHALAHDASTYSSTLFETSREAPDATVEAFIAEFLNNDTAWNPF